MLHAEAHAMRAKRVRSARRERHLYCDASAAYRRAPAVGADAASAAL